MKAKSKRGASKSRRRAKPQGTPAAPGRFRQLLSRLGPFLPLVFLLLPALIVTAGTEESFRLPKQIVSEALVLLSLALLALRLRRVDRVTASNLLKHPAFLAVLPLTLVATLTLFIGEHPLHTSRAVASLWIAAAALVGWSLALRTEEFERILRLLAVPATVLSAVALAQYFQWGEIFRYEDEVQERIGLTSLAGGAFDLAAYLVPPALMALAFGWGREERFRQAWWVSGALFTVVIGLTGTLSALAALLIGALVIAGRRLPLRRFGVGLLTLVILVSALGVAVPTLRERLDRKASEIQEGGWNDVLSGRLDGWRTAVWMVEQEPLLGVGHGAYRAEFGFAKIDLRKKNVKFYLRQHQPYFVNAHNEPLEVAAETGIVGLLALLFGLWRLLLALRRSAAPDPLRDLMWAVGAATAVLSLANFPFRIALVAYPLVLFAAWIFAWEKRPEAMEEKEEARGIPGRRLVFVVVPLLLAAFAVDLRHGAQRWLASHRLEQVQNLVARLQAEGHLDRASSQRGVRRAFGEASKQLRQAQAMDPAEVAIPIARGGLYRLLGQENQAFEAFEDARAIEPRPEVFSQLGRIHLELDEPQKARRNFRFAVLLDHTLRKELKPYLLRVGDTSDGD